MSNPSPDFSRYFWRGDLVRLRPLRVEDAERSFLASLDSPSRQLLQLGVELPTTVELERAKLERFANFRDVNSLIVLAIETLAGELVGGISMHSMDRKNGVFSFGISVYQGYQGRGYATEAARILLRYGFWEQRYQKCNSACAAINAASIALHEKLGFVREGLRRQVLFINGQYHDDILWGMTREEFDAREESLATN